jgi:hypothetical protein
MAEVQPIAPKKGYAIVSVLPYLSFLTDLDCWHAFVVVATNGYEGESDEERIAKRTYGIDGAVKTNC